MYRLNRIGGHIVADMDQSTVIKSDSNFNSLDGGNDTFGCFRLTAASGDDQFAGTNFHYTSAPTLASNMAVGLGVDITAERMDRNYMVHVSGHINYVNTDSALKLQCVLGRLVGASSSSAQVLVTTPIFLPAEITVNGDQKSANVNSTVLLYSGIFGGTIPGTEYNLAAFWHFVNEKGSVSAAITNLAGRISLHKWTKDLLTWDPPRV